MSIIVVTEAIGDGVTDDIAAIQAAIDSAVSGDTVVLGKRTYALSKTIHLPNGVEIASWEDL